jgi:hypothetical protein
VFILKKFYTIFVVAGLLFSLNVYGEESSPMSSTEKEQAYGFKMMMGGRYDDMRMCVASPAGTQGGPVGDIKFFMRFGFTFDWYMTVTIPIFRPILFGAAFKMLQYESDIAMEYKIPVSNKVAFSTGPGIGFSYHYGPDYNSENSGDNRTESFFALGPMISYYNSFDIKWPKTYATRIGVQLFHISLFRVDEFQYGKIFGGALELGMYF